MVAFLFLCGVGLLLMLLEALKWRKIVPFFLTGSVLMAYVLSVLEWKDKFNIGFFENMIGFDKPAIAFSSVIIISFFIWLFAFMDTYKNKEGMSEIFILALFSVCGALMLTSFRHMASFFIGLEIMSIPLYVLAASAKNKVESNEAGFKYLIMGSFFSAVILFGLALMYGATGSFEFVQIKTQVKMFPEKIPAFFHAGLILLLIGMLFKASLFPFHFWAPDVYEGAPTPVTAFMSTIVKTSVMAAAFRLFSFSFNMFHENLEQILLWSIVLTLLVSNITAAVQTNVKRLMAYSSISHSAFLFMIIYVNIKNNISINTLMFYTLAYSVASLGFFAVLNYIAGYEEKSLDVFKGLAYRNKFVAFTVLICLLSMAGIPLTAGFFAKYYVLTLLGVSGNWTLLVLAVIASLIGVYYYLRIIILMYFKEPANSDYLEVSDNFKTALFISSLLIILFGIAPAVIFEIFKV
ncbi:MAG: NADH-quinone oxidoreductase subunit N [Bacteroidia bacterium]|nr:NADH-quinone oxidoreductase subunit N [Bacteroidia bacterium]